MKQVMKGVRVLEVAQFVFVPAAGAVLADWGAEVIKVEPPGRGDTQRAMRTIGGVEVDPVVNPMIEHPNRGKRSVGIDISTEEGRRVLYRLAEKADVFLTNYLPSARKKLGIDIEAIRKVNPGIIYARGSGYGDKGPDRDRGSFDATAFWIRSGLGAAMTPEDFDVPLTMGVGGFGDSISGMFLAGGIAAALFERERSGEPSEVDVSLLSSAMWSMGQVMGTYLKHGILPQVPAPQIGGARVNPFLGNFRTRDGRVIALFMIAPGPYIRDTFEHLGIAEAADDPRFADASSLMRHSAEASDLITKAFATRDFDDWCRHLETMRGQWAPAQTMLDLGHDEQAIANDAFMEIEPIDGSAPMRVVRSPVQFDHEPFATPRAPQLSEDTETVLLELGLEWDEIEGLKQKGAVG